MFDQEMMFSDRQAITADAASTDHITLGQVQEIGAGCPVYLIVIVNVALDAASGNETYQVNLEHADNTAFSTNKETVATLTFTRGDAPSTMQGIAIPVRELRQYMRCYYNVGGTTPSGTFTAGLMGSPPEWFKVLPAVD